MGIESLRDYEEENLVAGGGDAECLMGIRGHWLYCRKCFRPEEDGGIVIPEKTQDQCCWVEILAKGSKVGQQRDNIPKHLKGQYIRHIDMSDIKVGDIVLAERTHGWGIIHSVKSEYEFFIDESIVICKAEDDQPRGTE